MTAVNVLLTADEVHVFSDGGHYDPAGNIVRVGAKTFHLPRYDAILAFSGPTGAIPEILRRIEEADIASLAGLCAAAAVLLAGAVPIEMAYSVILAGIEDGETVGVALEERGRVHQLGPGSMVRSLSCHITFDPLDIVGSGRRMMAQQRAEHGVVAGFCLHSCLSRGALSSYVLDRWPILMAKPFRPSFAAKIANLEVDTINIANNAALAVVTGTSSIGVPNPMAAPVKLFASGTANYRNTGSSGSVQFEIRIRASTGNRILAIYTFTRAGSGTEALHIPLSAVDLALHTSQTYTVQTETFAATPGLGITIIPWSDVVIKALYRKR
ncbi:hypothetical protein [Aliihoeflea sp. 2WW]|uniref:hypothetical protein n=1 Tax=Aliihoeflea sp. 2WW TaxID=1381123 RepID=UPI0004655DCE|nr:hypothetical protein [Aliihoeflea sp. 2WW]